VTNIGYLLNLDCHGIGWQYGTLVYYSAIFSSILGIVAIALENKNFLILV